MRTQIVVMVNPHWQKCSPPLEATIKDGLAIHRSLTTDGDSEWKFRWTVTHVESGMALLAGLPTPKDANDLLNELLPITDWTRDQAWIYEHVSREGIQTIVDSYKEKVIDADCGNQYL